MVNNIYVLKNQGKFLKAFKRPYDVQKLQTKLIQLMVEMTNQRSVEKINQLKQI